MPDQDWITEGAAVAEYTQHTVTAHVVLTTIERLTQTQVVLANGNRYNRRTLRQVGAGSWDRTELMPAGAREVRNSLAGKHLSHVAQRVHELAKGNRGGVDAVLSVLDQIEQAAQRARAAITAGAEPPAEEG